MRCQQPRNKPQMPTPAASNDGPKQPQRRNTANCAQATTNEPASKPKRIGFIVCLGHVFVCVAPEATSHPNRLRPKQPRRRHNPETASSCMANPPLTPLRSPALRRTRCCCCCCCSVAAHPCFSSPSVSLGLRANVPPGVLPHNVPHGLPPHNVSREIIRIGTNNRRVRRHTDKGLA